MQSENNCNFEDFVCQREPNERFFFQPINVATVYTLITKLSTSKATGVDKISAKVLKSGFLLGEFVPANKQKANVIGW